ncbi:MAG: SGNH/GDSL hydrolase family protein [Myxococcaceae bacterium]|nr:SGNH/GDSL hydrolase family protein [Myxococcaceae bacterium]
MTRALPVLLVCLACGAPPVALPDGGLVDDEPVDAGAVRPDAGNGLADAGPLDAGAGDAGATAPDAGAPADGGLVSYPFGATHSPLTAQLVRNLAIIAGRSPRNADAFMKVGDSNTVNTNFLSCFAGPNVDLAGRAVLQPTIDAFKATRLGGATPFDRVSRSAIVGWSAGAALTGTPPPVEQELADTNARFATVMFGTNDIQSMNLDAYGRNLFALVDLLVSRGVVPVVTAIPPRDDSVDADRQVPLYNGVARALAQSRGVPFVDLERELRRLPNHGIGSDGLHLNVLLQGGFARGCVLSSAGLQFGHNQRNLVTLEALRRTRDAVVSGVAADVSAAVRRGTGTALEPFLIDSVPFVDVRDTRRDGARGIDRYDACSAANEGGPEVLYRLDVTTTQTLRVVVVALGTADLDVHVLRGAVAASACVARNDKVLRVTVTPGTWYLSVDTYVSAGTERAGEYALLVFPE